jgi:parallel beta-helix repeat protein
MGCTEGVYTTRMMHFVSLVAYSLLLQLEGAPLPVVEVTLDDTVIDKSCMVVIPEGLVIEDANGDGVLHIETDGVSITFVDGSVLRGASPETDLDQLLGIGIVVRGCKDVKLFNLHVSGFKVGLLAQEVEGCTLSGGRFEGNFAQQLLSTPEKEDVIDWIWPHENDQQQWRKNYGAAVCVERSANVKIEGVTVRRGQNGILFDRVLRSYVGNNDCSFLSGWGLAMWRSSDNLVFGNAFDFCVRGYSHGVYNRGQDSAGILMFEQCHRNRVIQNSATHGGDGFFGFAGKEALGEVGEHESDWYKRRGNNDNMFVGNDFSFAAAHGLEMTFSFGNRILGNNFQGNSICGIWCGFSQDLVIAHNTFSKNGFAGYGMERGDVNIDHGSNNRLMQNAHAESACAVHLWELATSYSQKPWGKANLANPMKENFVLSSRFKGNGVDFHMRGPVQLAVYGNDHEDAESPNDVAKESVIRIIEDASLESEQIHDEADDRPSDLKVNPNPVGARRHLAGRQNIIMTMWGPWDHVSPRE